MTTRLGSSGPFELAAITLGSDMQATADVGQEHAWRKRAIEDEAAWAACENPKESVKKLKGATHTGDKLRTWIDKAVESSWCELKRSSKHGENRDARSVNGGS